MRRAFTLALLVAAVFPAAARADWWSDYRLAQRGIAHAVQVEWMTPDDAATYRSILSETARTWRTLPGSRSANLAAVLHDVARQWQAYIAPRAVALFGMLEMNRRYLGGGAMPPDGADILDGDGVVYRAFAGHGLQFHPLANFARLNRLIADGDSTGAAWLAAALIARAVPRAGSLVWEYYFPFDGGWPPWTSGMVQAVAARAFAADADYDVARKAYLALQRLVFPLGGGSWIRLYSFSSVAVLNAQLQSALSLADYAQLNQDPSAQTLSGRLLQTADAFFARFDTGAWSLYSLGGVESPLNYHVFDLHLLQRIAASTESPVWAARANRFERYTTEAPVVHASARVVKRQATISLWISKISRVSVTIAGSTSTLTLSRGSHSFSWSAAGRRPGRYAVRVSATDLAGNRTTDGFAIVVKK